MSQETFRIGRLTPGLHLRVSDDPIRFAMDDARLEQSLNDSPPTSWRFIEPGSDDVPIFLYWEGICVEAHRRPRAWVVALLAILEQSRPNPDGNHAD